MLGTNKVVVVLAKRIRHCQLGRICTLSIEPELQWVTKVFEALGK